MHLRLRVAGEHYALPVEAAVEVVERGELTPVPGAPSPVAGVRNVRGRILPVFDLAALLGVATAEAERIVVVEHAGERVGLAVDAVPGVERLPPAAGAASDRLAGSVLVDGALVGVLDVAGLYAALSAGMAA